MKKPRALVIDDEEFWQKRIQKRLDPSFEVTCVATGEAGLEAMRKLRPALVILDASFATSAMQGRDVLIQVKTEKALQRIPVLMLTAVETPTDAFRWKADEYVKKSDFATQFDARVEQLLKRAALWPFDSYDEPTLSLFLRDRVPVDMIVGVIELHEQTEKPLRLDMDDYKSQGRSAYAGNWQDHARSIGHALYGILMEHREIAVAIEAAISRCRRVNVAGPVDMLDVPLEFLQARMAREYFVLHYPFSRSVLNVHPARGYAPSITPKFLNDLHRRGAPLRVLLIAANTGGIPMVDREVDEIRAQFETNPRGLRTEVLVLHTAKATLEAVSAELQNPYHIVHYAGHGDFVSTRTQDHRLMLWNAHDATTPESLAAGQLQLLWGDNRPGLFYMSACRGAAVGNRSDLFNNDLLGLIDAAIAAGVPSVIGFRWPVTDNGAYQLSAAFYAELLKTGRPDHALRNARRTVCFKNRNDPAWLSPVLVMQSP